MKTKEAIQGLKHGLQEPFRISRSNKYFKESTSWCGARGVVCCNTVVSDVWEDSYEDVNRSLSSIFSRIGGSVNKSHEADSSNNTTETATAGISEAELVEHVPCLCTAAVETTYGKLHYHAVPHAGGGENGPTTCPKTATQEKQGVQDPGSAGTFANNFRTVLRINVNNAGCVLMENKTEEIFSQNPVESAEEVCSDNFLLTEVEISCVSPSTNIGRD